MRQGIEGRSVVVTGASSGIGRATGLLFARHGARVAVAARRLPLLEEVARECRTLGTEAIAHPADVADMGAVDRLADRVLGTFGRIDVWVNAAAVAAFGRFDETPAAVFDRLMAVNVNGTANCARAAYRAMRSGGGGVFIPIASTLGKAAIPYLGAYNASKFAVVGLAESLRQEWEEDGIQVCTVMPPPTDTPFYEHAANYTGLTVRPPHPVYDAETVAEAIVDCVRHPRREVAVGLAATLQHATHAVAPRAYERLAGPYVERTMFVQDEPVDVTEGSVFVPLATGTTIEGGWKEGEDVE